MPVEEDADAWSSIFVARWRGQMLAASFSKQLWHNDACAYRDENEQRDADADYNSPVLGVPMFPT